MSVCVMLLLCPAPISSADPHGNINSPPHTNPQLDRIICRLTADCFQMSMVDERPS